MASRGSSLFVLLSAGLLAVVSARNYAGCWNDGSRLATVECLVDYHTLAIDRSIYVQVPQRQAPGDPLPYPETEPELLRLGTGDKLFIDGHYYSDKSPVPALLMAGVYQAWQWCTGGTARERPDAFCLLLTLTSSGLAYVVAVWCVFQLGRPLLLSLPLRLGLTASFALATVAMTYARHVNNHVLLLGVAAALFLELAWLADATRNGRIPWPRLVGIGMLAGLGYTIDLGAGPVLLLCLMALIAYRCRRLSAVAAFGLAALPWLVAHHAVNYAVGGTFKPANAVPEYFLWPGCTFTPQNLTGSWNHSPGEFIEYAAGLLFGRRGFFGHNLPLLLALPGIVVLLRKRPAEKKGDCPSSSKGQSPFFPEMPEVLCAGCWSGGTWLAYALTSNNYSGQCCSIRWFVPLLAPGYYVLALFLRQHRSYRWDFLVLSGWGVLLGTFMWYEGPWTRRVMPYAWFWVLQAVTLLSWYVCRRWRWRREAIAIPISGAAHRAEAA